MRQGMKKCSFYGEYVYCQENEKDEAKQYLLLWKKFFVMKLKRKYSEVAILDESFIERDPMCNGILAQEWTIVLKLYVSLEHGHELHTGLDENL